jgi:hypothetical protein
MVEVSMVGRLQYVRCAYSVPVCPCTEASMRSMNASNSSSYGVKVALLYGLALLASS